MCRFVAYIGSPMIIEELIIKPSNSLVNQSFDAQDSEMTINGDGFGIGWYDKELKEEPGLYVSVLPAWNDKNLLNIASITQSSCFFAHVRAATIGGVSLENCHPFKYNEYLMMHNGGIEDFDVIKKDMVALLDDEAFLWIKGQSDTQYMFALFMTNARKLNIKERPDNELLIQCLDQTFGDIAEDIHLCKNLELDIVEFLPFIPQINTPFQYLNSWGEEDIKKTIAIAKLILKEKIRNSKPSYIFNLEKHLVN